MPHEPKKRHSKTVKRIRRAALAMKAVNLMVCKNCQAKTLAHMACRKCGFYSGKAVGDAETKVTRA